MGTCRVFAKTNVFIERKSSGISPKCHFIYSLVGCKGVGVNQVELTRIAPLFYFTQIAKSKPIVDVVLNVVSESTNLWLFSFKINENKLRVCSNNA